MSLRTRLFLTYALTIVLCLTLVSVFVTVMLQKYRDQLTMDRLDDTARPLFTQIRAMLRDQTTAREYWTILEQQAQKNNLYMLFGSAQGNLVRQVLPGEAETLQIPAGGLPHSGVKAEQGIFYTTGGQAFIYSAYPLGNAINKELPGLNTLVIAVPRTASLAVWVALIRPILVSGLVALAISLIIAIFISRSVYKPVFLVTDAAKKVARGQYDHQVPVSGPQEIKDLGISFNRMTGEVKRSQQQLRHFVADISHQLKSPLTSIMGFAQAMLDGTAGSEETKNRAAAIIYDESKRMRQQVDELLELARMQSGQLKMAVKPVIISDLLEHCYELYSIQAKEKDIILIRESEPGLVVMGDVDRLEQVFNNLLDNAIKNTPAHGNVRIVARRVKAAADIRVTDDGPGIPAEQIPHVFERFYQVTGVRTGVGLGLAIAREIVLAHNGTIEARSEPGAGAEFVVNLPALPGNADSVIFKG